MGITKIDGKTISKTIETRINIADLKAQLDQLQATKIATKNGYDVAMDSLQASIDALKVDIAAAKAVGVE